jgi:hypothetical protein
LNYDLINYRKAILKAMVHNRSLHAIKSISNHRIMVRIRARVRVRVRVKVRVRVNYLDSD